MENEFAITYKVTTKTNRIWIGGDLGFAYQCNGAFIHIQGDSQNSFWTSVNADMVITEKANGDLEGWVKKVFGATNIKQTLYKVGTVAPGVWRPGIYYQNSIYQAFNLKDFEMRSAERVLLSLIDRLEDLFSYIEPSVEGLRAFGHKNRELLILACTEVENAWKRYMGSSKPHLSTSDYIKLRDRLFLREYKLKLKPVEGTPVFHPFENWEESEPTKSLKWYNAYNAVKHDRQENLHLATLENCILAVAANMVLFAVRYGPYRFFRDGLGHLFTRTESLFELFMNVPDPTTFYVPKFVFEPANIGGLARHPANYCVSDWKSIDL